MKKLLLAILVINGIVFEAVSAATISPDITGGGTSIINPSDYEDSRCRSNICATGLGITYGSSCNADACQNCISGYPKEQTSINGVITITDKYLDVTCPTQSYGGVATCSCATTTSYKCATGYCGSPTSSSTGCVKTPDTATCTNNTIVCKVGYYKSGNDCLQCPSSADYKKSIGTTLYGTTAAAGATSKSECYLPKDTEYRDTNGNKFKATANCPYNN